MLLVHALLALALWSVRTPELRSPAAEARTLPITVWLPALAVPAPVSAPASVAAVRRFAPPDAPETPAAPVVAAAPSTAITVDWHGQGYVQSAAEAAKRPASHPPAPLGLSPRSHPVGASCAASARKKKRPTATCLMT